MLSFEEAGSGDKEAPEEAVGKTLSSSGGEVNRGRGGSERMAELFHSEMFAAELNGVEVTRGFGVGGEGRRRREECGCDKENREFGAERGMVRGEGRRSVRIMNSGYAGIRFAREGEVLAFLARGCTRGRKRNEYGEHTGARGG